MAQIVAIKPRLWKLRKFLAPSQKTILPIDFSRCSSMKCWLIFILEMVYLRLNRATNNANSVENNSRDEICLPSCVRKGFAESTWCAYANMDVSTECQKLSWHVCAGIKEVTSRMRKGCGARRLNSQSHVAHAPFWQTKSKSMHRH